MSDERISERVETSGERRDRRCRELRELLGDAANEAIKELKWERIGYTGGLDE